MAKRPSNPILLPIFGGQGTLSFNPEDGSRRFRQLTSSPTGMVLLDACFDAFHAELASLPAEVVQQVGICANDFMHKSSLLCPEREEYLSNPVISGSTLLLLQVSKFLYYVESSAAPRNNRLDSLLQYNAQYGVGVLGFSSGIIAATVVAASRTKLDFIRHAVEAYRLAFWIGVRSQLFRMSYMSNSTGIFQDFRPWALVIFALDRSAMQQALLSFNERVFITSVIDDGCVTVSGHPDDLAAFKSFLPAGTRICETNIVALYHVPSKLNGVREALLKDVASRGICFPTFQDLFVPVRSSFDGGIVNGSLCDQPLIQSIVDMVLVQPVNWEAVVNCTVASIPSCSGVELLNVDISKTLLKGFENSLPHHCISDFRYFDLKNEDGFPTARAQVPIAIVGMAVKMPGAESVDELWNTLTKGLNTLETIPADRFDYCNGEKPGRGMAVSTGNFVKSAGEFDNKFFGISPREAKSMDPQQRMLLHVAYEALENAGYVPDSTPTFLADEFGCFIGAATHDYVHNLRNDVDVYYSTGTLGAFLSGRLSYCLGLGGPSIVVDTACSSSLVAIHQATRALMNGDCKAALAGGVNVISSPDMFLGLDKGHFLSPSGGCKSFDASADGYSRAEGCGIFVLKRLCDAIAEKDRILGVIRGIEVNQSGKAQSITHPHAPTQEELFRLVVERSDVKAHSVNFVEAHGPGTQAGDVTELSSLRRVFATDRPSNNPLSIGSLKANIGHLEAASGAASLAKVLLMLSHETIPAQISLRTLNPMIPPLHVDNTIISTANLSWVPAIVGAPRLALINNFGAAGSNAAMVVEEHISTPTQRHSTSISSYVFGLSAKEDLALRRLRTNLIKWLEVNPQVSLADLSYTLMARRQAYAYRLVVTAGTTEELISRLNSSIPAHVPQQQNFPVVFVFSGQGAQYRSMGSSLYLSSPLFKKHIDECDAILRGSGFLGILAVITGDDQNKDDDSSEEEATQAAMFALEYALAMVWMSWGIKPIALVGHSLGEYTALVIGGTLQLRDALIIIATRARLLFEKCAYRATGMLAVALEPEKLQCILDSSRRSELSISCYNSPQACVVAGPVSELTALEHFLEAEISCDCTLLDLPFAYHSPTMAAIHDDLLSIGSNVKTRPPSIPVVSTVFGRVYFPGDASFFSKDYFAKHCSYPVRFTDAIGSYLSCPTLGGVNTVWLEIGSHSSLLPMLQSFPSLARSSFVASLHKKQDSWTTISRALASFYLTRTVDWRAVFAQIGPASVLSLPSYPYSPNKYWVPFRKVATEFSDSNSKFTLIRNWKQRPNIRNGGVAILETSTACLKPYIEGHRVGGVPLCPASIYLELAAAGVTLSLSHLSRSPRNDGLLFEHINFSKPLVLKNAEREDVKSVRLTVNPTTCAFSIDTEEDPVHHEGLTKHAEGSYQLLELSKICGEFKEFLPSVDLSLDRLNSTDTQHLERFSTRTIYDLLFSRVVDYSKDFHTIQSLTISPDTMEATAKVRLDKGFQSGHFVINPLFLDTLVHIPGFMANLLGGQADIHICARISSISLLPDTIDTGVDYTIYARGTVVPDGVIYESYAVRNGSSRALVAIAKGIHFQRVHLNSLKVGLASLVRATSAESGSVPSRPCVSMKSTVLGIIARNCNVSVDDISPQDDLDSLGIDSLMRLALRHDLVSTFPNIQVPCKDISACRYVRELVDLISKFLTQTNMSGASTSSQTTIVSSPDLSAHATQLSRIISQVLHDEDLLTDYEELGSFGLDSLSCIEATRKFATQHKTHLPTNFLHPRQNLSDIWACPVHAQSLPDDLLPPAEGKAASILTKRLHHALGLDTKLWALQTSNSSRTPLVLVHDGSGLAVSYRQISSLDRRLYGINNPHFLTSQTWSSITQIAESYANFIQEELDEPVIFGGWSFGGVVAFELAKILQARSHPVKGVILIDSPDPFDTVPLSPEVINYVLSAIHDVSPQAQKLCKSQFMTNSQLLTKYNPHDVQLSGTIPIVFLRSKEGFNPPNVDIVPKWLSNRSCTRSLTSGWTVLSGLSIQMIDIPGNHFSAFDSHNIEETSRCIGEACEILDGNTLVQTSRPL